MSEDESETYIESSEDGVEWEEILDTVLIDLTVRVGVISVRVLCVAWWVGCCLGEPCVPVDG